MCLLPCPVLLIASLAVWLIIEGGGGIKDPSFFGHSKERGRPGQLAAKAARGGDNDRTCGAESRVWVGKEIKRRDVKAERGAAS